MNLTRWQLSLFGACLVSAVLVTVGIASPVDVAGGGSFRGHRGTPVAHSYVALGDSFTSGPGIPSQLGPSSTPSAPRACLRSSDDYPSLVARALGLALRDVSCAGATTEDLGESQGPGIPPQLSTVGQSTSIVSIGIGGNDLGFANIASNCVAATPWGGTRTGWNCGSHYTVGGVDQLALDVHEVATKVTASLKEIRSRAPHAKVYVIGYPTILPATGSGCWPRLPFSAHDVDYLKTIEADLNAALARDAAGAGDVYVDLATPSKSHSACADADSRWVDPILGTRGSYPLHPSVAGMDGMAQIVEEAFKNRTSLDRSCGCQESRPVGTHSLVHSRGKAILMQTRLGGRGDA